MTLRLPALLLAVCALAACGGDEKPATPAPFAYEADEPLDARDEVIERAQGVDLHDVSFAAGTRTRIRAYMFTRGEGTARPAVILLHGAGGDRAQLVSLAAQWARTGGIALTIDSAQAANTANAREELRAQRDAAAQTVVRVRRAVDYVESLGSEQIGFIGFSAGARTGAILAGVEPRLDALVLWSGGATSVAEYAAESPPELRKLVQSTFHAVDPLRFIALARPNTIFFQAGRRDEIVPGKALRALIAAAPKPQKVQWYDAGHQLTEQAYKDAQAWLAEHLKPVK